MGVMTEKTSGKPSSGFAKARDTWLDWALRKAPHHTIRTFCTVLSLHFNVQIYEASGQLVAWPPGCLWQSTA